MRRIVPLVRRSVVPVVAAALLAGCSAFTDTDVAARVGDAELTTDELEDLVPAVNPGVVPTSAEAVRNTISIWLLVETVSARLDDDGIEIPDGVRDQATTVLSDPAAGLQGWADLDGTTQDQLVEWQAVLEVLNTQGPEYRDEALAGADVEVAPRFGEFDPDVGVIPLGLPTDATLG
jgi:hypothetical protein